MDFRHLKYFVAVAQERSFTRAAAASARIRAMETSLGTDFLQRGRRGVTPTPAGKALAQHARVLLQQAERMQQDFAPFRTTLDDTQKQSWDAELRALLGAKRAPIYTLVNGKPEMVQVRIGASDGTSTEVSGGVKEGDVVVVGERAKE